jgi:outer membrane immunogenic protein
MMPYTRTIGLAALAGLGLAAAPAALAADLGYAPPEPIVEESWTGFYVGGGGGIGFLNTEMNSSASRSDALSICKVKKDDKEKKECEKKEHDKKFPPFLTLLQSQAASFDVGDEGFFGTVQLGYDKQLGQRWVIGGFVDADWYSDLEADGHQSSSTALNIDLKHLLKLDLPLSNITTDASIGMDWSISVGGRFGFLATPGTLLYVLGAYTHAELDKSRVNVSIDDPLSSLKFFQSNPTAFALNLPDELDGFTLGAGGEAKLGKNSPWSLKLEYRWSHFDGGSASGSFSDEECIPFHKYSKFGIGRETEATASADYDDIDLHTVRGVLTYRFGGAPEVASLK